MQFGVQLWVRRIKITAITWAAVFAACVLGLCGLFIYSVLPSFDNELLFTNGTVLTIEYGEAEALLVRDGKIVAVGNEAEVAAKASSSAEQFDLNGGTLMPGLVEPHTHPIATALLSATVDVSGFSHSNREQVMNTLRDAAEGFSPNGWVIAFGWDPVMVPDLTAPTLAELDQLSPDKPLLILTQMMHDAYANSAALAAAGIDRYTPNPVGGEFLRDSAGNLNGTVREVSAINRLFAGVPKPPAMAVGLMTQRQLQHYASAGYTSIGVLGPVGRSESPLQLLDDLLNHDAAPLRARTWALPEQLAVDSKPYSNDRYGLRGVKFWMDGSPFAGGAAWEQPYENSKLVLERLDLPKFHSPKLHLEREAFQQQFVDYHQRGFAIAIHAQGERAIDEALNVAEAALRQHPRKDHGHRLEHNALITPQQIARAKRLGFALSFFVDHVWFYGHRLPELIGNRTFRYMPLREARKQGSRISLHGDHPATPIKPFRSLKTAVTRSMRLAEGKLAPRQALTVEDGLRAMTIDAAWQLGMEQQIGSLVEGKQADLVWLDHNPLVVDPSELDQIKVKATWLAGNQVDTGFFSQRNVGVFLRQLF